MSIPFISSQARMYMTRFPNFMRCYSCKFEFDEAEMSVDPLNDHPHALVCQKCKQYALNWLKNNKRAISNNKKYQEPRPVDSFWDTERSMLDKFNF